METERQLQERVKHWLINDLHYEFLGSLENINNSYIIKNLLQQNLESRNYRQEVIKKAIADFEQISENQNSLLYHINEKVYNLLRYGDMSVKDKNGHDITVNYIDWKNFEKNDFYVAEEVSILCSDGKTHKRPDLVLYVNGIALGMIELKNSRVSIGEGIRQLIRNQNKDCIQNFFSLIYNNKTF